MTFEGAGDNTLDDYERNAEKTAKTVVSIRNELNNGGISTARFYGAGAAVPIVPPLPPTRLVKPASVERLFSELSFSDQIVKRAADMNRLRSANINQRLN